MGGTDGTGTTDPVDTTGAASSSTGGGGPPSSCGPPCDETWEHFGNLNVDGRGDFSCLTRVHGDLFTTDKADPATIATLGNLLSVDGTIRITHSSLTDLSTFACLEQVGELVLWGLPQVTDASLPALRVAPSIEVTKVGASALPSFAPEFQGVTRIELYSNPDLVDLSPASGWGLWSDELMVMVDGNAELQSLAGLGPLLASDGLKFLSVQVTNHPALTSLAGLESVTEATLYLAGLPALANLDPLKKLTTGSVVLIDIPKVTDLKGLSGLTTANQLMIGDCVNMGTGGMNGLTSLAGLDSLTAVESFALANNMNLTSLAGAPKLTEVASLEVVNNPKLTQPAFDAFIDQLAAAPPSCFGGWDVCQCFVIMPW